MACEVGFNFCLHPLNQMSGNKYGGGGGGGFYTLLPGEDGAVRVRHGVVARQRHCVCVDGGGSLDVEAVGHVAPRGVLVIHNGDGGTCRDHEGCPHFRGMSSDELSNRARTVNLGCLIRPIRL